MPSDAAPESTSNELDNTDQGDTSLPSDAQLFASKFTEALEQEFVWAAASLPENAKLEDLFAAMSSAYREVMADFGGRKYANVPPDATPMSDTWDADSNSRRIELIEKQFASNINASESEELQNLTRRMRAVTDADAMVPLSGARALLRQLRHQHPESAS
jgi:hypothetical protein